MASQLLLAATLLILIGPVVPAVAGPVGSGAAGVDDARLRAAAGEPQNWLTHGRDYAEQRFSPLEQIDAKNVGRLVRVWSYETGLQRGHEATPIVVDGVLYATGSWSVVFALDARTGKELWRYDPEVPKAVGAKACCDVVNRGVAVYEGHCPAHGRFLPYLPIVELLRSFFGIRDEDTDRTAREKIAGRLLLGDRSLESDLPILDEDLPPAASDLPALDDIPAVDEGSDIPDAE